MATNNFKPFGIGAGANVTSQADYEALAALLSGFQSGKASSAQINKAIRQATVMSYVLAQFIANSSGNDVLDNGDTATIITNLISALKANSANDFLQKSNNLIEIKNAGTSAQSSARANLGLGTAATATIGTGANQLPSMASFTSGSGWVKFPDGTIIQTGTTIVGPLATPTAISFPIPFTQMGYKVTTSFDQASGSSNDCPSFAVSPQAVGWAYFMSSRKNGVNAGCNWIAVGR